MKCFTGKVFRGQDVPPAEGLLSSIYTLSGYEGSAKVEQIESGRHFGEECVLGDNPRSSTVTAATDCVLLEIERQVIRELAVEDGKFLVFSTVKWIWDKKR